MVLRFTGIATSDPWEDTIMEHSKYGDKREGTTGQADKPHVVVEKNIGDPVDGSEPRERLERASARHDGLSDEDRIKRDADENRIRSDAANARRDGLTIDEERERREKLERDNVNHPDPAAADQPAGGTKEERGSPDAGKDLPDPAPAKDA